ncbi:Tn3 family transposase [Nonomuraea terrae]|uniref:Tn3 family transposase n=1 Tax=Nonomuraea terrae TaxID=2530383 RepID=A0A4R4ZAH9_9ACTN|nr:Tn3 family transposase [Nonomuraea terrae]
MPAEFLCAEQRATYASFIEVPSLSDMEKFFFLDSFDRNVIAQSRADSHRLGVAVQIGTVRYKGLFLEDPLAVPWPVVDYLAEQLGIGDASQVKKYAERPKTTYEHAWMIRDAYGYHTFDDTDSWSERQLARQFRTFLHGRAWTHAEGPVASPPAAARAVGITWLNAVNDLVAGIGQMVVPGTPRDSLYILDCLINLDAGPKPEVVTTDQASDSDMVFGIFSMLGYRFAPRFADLGDQRFWRAELPDSSTGDYGVLEAIARNKLNTKKVITQWPDMLRVAGSLVTNQVRAYDLLRMFARQGSPTPLGQAFAEYGRIDKTMHLLSMLDPMDSSYRRSLGKQLSVQESRHRLARKICHSNAGRIRQAYREGQEDQLAALGLVVNAVVLWNSRYLSAIVDQLRAQGVPVKDEDVARLSPLGHAHLNCLGRYAIASSAPDKGLRPLGTAALPRASTASAAVVDEDGV